MSSLVTLPAVQHQAAAPPASLARGIEPIVSAVEALKAIRTFVASELKPDVDFGVIPGTGAKPTLLKPGAEKVALYYNTRVSYHLDRMELGDGHLELNVRCDLLSRQSGAVAAEGYGSCSTMESKYRWRKGDRTCPHCGAAAIIKGKAEYGGGWLCFAKRGGCGAKFGDADPAITSQQTGREPNPDVWDVRNTVLKMAMKRALVSAVLSLGSLSELFTQDIEDTYDLGAAAPRVDAEDARRQEINEAFKPPARGNGNGGKRDNRPFYQLVAAAVESVNGEFSAEFPDSQAKPLNGLQVNRHLLKWAVANGWIPAPEGSTSNTEVSKLVAALYGGEHRKAVRAELAAYAGAKLAEARNRAAGEALDVAGGSDIAPDEPAGDPEHDFDEPGSDG